MNFVAPVLNYALLAPILIVLGFYPSPLLTVINPASAHVLQVQGFTDPVPSESAGNK
jgi:NADH:ubiquinone oxidoreductase subunit 4 (subunit M)